MNPSPWASTSVHPSQRQEKPKLHKDLKLGKTRRDIDDLKERKKFNEEFNYL